MGTGTCRSARTGDVRSAGYDRGASKLAEASLEEALGLPADERVMLASGLLASLDSEVADDDEIDRLWPIETERRAAMLESGEARTFTRDEILEGLVELRAKRTA